MKAYTIQYLIDNERKWVTLMAASKNDAIRQLLAIFPSAKIENVRG